MLASRTPKPLVGSYYIYHNASFKKRKKKIDNILRTLPYTFIPVFTVKIMS